MQKTINNIFGRRTDRFHPRNFKHVDRNLKLNAPRYEGVYQSSNEVLVCVLD